MSLLNDWLHIDFQFYKIHGTQQICMVYLVLVGGSERDSGVCDIS
jgi:hypothetical protein